MKTEKLRWLAISVTTAEAFKLCLAEEIPVICVEEPLYPQIQGQWHLFPQVVEYERTEYESLRCVMLKKIHGNNAFDDSQYELFYYPFTRM